ncbi:MAG: hypothetical protein ACOYNY_45010 [Caldilineaceae bacterium]|jgi:PHD/YefM family antitoxin component YafN of YafNO toxin-antitoxin module
MTPYTLPIDRSDTQVLELIKRAQAIQRPLMLLVDSNPEPVAVLLKKDAYEQTQQQQERLRQQSYQLQLLQLKQALDRVEQQYDDAARMACIAIWQERIAFLWEVCPESVRGLCASLMLSVKLLKAETLSQMQISALQYCVALLRSVTPDEAEIEHAYHLLIDSDLPPALAFSDSLIQSYIDEL